MMADNIDQANASFTRLRVQIIRVSPFHRETLYPVSADLTTSDSRTCITSLLPGWLRLGTSAS